MYSLSVQNQRGEKLQLSYNSDYVVRAEGLNALTANINSTKSAGADGSRFNSAALNERNIVFYIKINPPVAANRNKLYKFFNTKNKLRIFYKNKLLNVFIDGIVETFNCEMFSNNETAIVSIICNDPYFRDTSETIIEFTNIIKLFEFPFSIPAAGIPFSEVERERQKIINHGDVESGMIIEFYANTSQILQPAFYNLTTQKYIKILIDMQQGDLVRINTNRGEKSITLIRDGVQQNIINDMQQGSEWVTLEAGENVISYSADEGQDNLDARIYTTNKYMGV